MDIINIFPTLSKAVQMGSDLDVSVFALCILGILPDMVDGLTYYEYRRTENEYGNAAYAC